MPHLPNVTITAWKHRNQGQRIDYMIRDDQGHERRLYARSDDPSTRALYEFLDARLRAIGYEGPRSGQQDTPH